MIWRCVAIMIHDAAHVRPAAFLISSLINQSLAHLFMIKLISSNPWPACFSIFRLASICEYFTGSCFLLNSAFLSLSKQVMQRSEAKSGFVIWVSYIQYFVHQRRDENYMCMTSQAWWVFRNCICMLYSVFYKYFKAIGDERRIMSKARCVIGGLWEPSRIIQPATKPSSDAICTLRKIDIFYFVFFCRCNL